MPQYSISNDASTVSIELTGVGGREKELLEAFQECQQGTCTCPTDQYQNVASMTVNANESRIAVHLEPQTRCPGGCVGDRDLVGLHHQWGGADALTSSAAGTFSTKLNPRRDTTIAGQRHEPREDFSA